MSELQLEIEWMESGQELTLAQLSGMCGLSEADLRELGEYGAVPLRHADKTGSPFPVHYLSSLRTAGRLREHYDLDLFAVAVMLDYLCRIETLDQQVRSLQAQLSGRGGPAADD